MIRTLTPVLSIIIGLLLFFIFARPMFAEITAIKAETAQYDRAVEQATTLNSKLAALMNQKNSFSEIERNKLDAFIPRDINEVKLLADLKELTRTHNMLIGNITVTEADGQVAGALDVSTPAISYDSLASSEITFSLIGTYDQFKSILRDIERSLVLMEITGINFSANAGSLMQFEVTVRTYALPTASNTQ